MNIIKKYSTVNTTYLKNRPLKYIVWHYTAGVSSKPGSAASSAGWFANPAAQASADFIVDDATIVQFNGDIENRYCWAVGGGKYNTKGGRLYGIASNKNCISIEICSNNTSGKITYPNDPRYSLTDASLNNALLLTRYLMEKYNIDTDHVIRHYDVSGKECPGVIGWNKESGSESTWKKWHDKINNKSGNSTTTDTSTSTSYYRVRKTWADEKSQLGAYTVKQNAIDNCPSGYKVFDENGKAVYTAKVVSGTQAADFAGLTESQAAAKILEMCKKDYEKTGVFASVSAAQMILESGYVKTELATKGNNCFGMKTTLSGNTWPNSTWDGKSKVNIRTAEEYTVGNITYINADFRKYSCLEDSIGDHSAYLLGAMNGSKKRYAGLTDCKNYRDAITLIKKGGYATDSAYVSKICNIIERFGLDKYDKIPVTSSPSTSTNTSTNNSTSSSTKSTLYRVGTEWKDGKCVNQDGAYASLDNAKKRVDALAKSGKTGYHVFDDKGVSVYPAATAESVFKPYSVRVDTPSLRIRKAPNGAAKKKLGREMYTGIGTFTIVAEEKAGDYTWGLLKSYEKKRNGWIALEYTKRI